MNQLQINRAEIPNNTRFQQILLSEQPNGSQVWFVAVNGIGTFRVRRHKSAANALLGFDVLNSSGTVVAGSPALEATLTLAEFDSATGYTGEAPTTDERLDALEAEVFE